MLYEPPMNWVEFMYEILFDGFRIKILATPLLSWYIHAVQQSTITKFSMQFNRVSWPKNVSMIFITETRTKPDEYTLDTKDELLVQFNPLRAVFHGSQQQRGRLHAPARQRHRPARSNASIQMSNKSYTTNHHSAMPIICYNPT